MKKFSFIILCLTICLSCSARDSTTIANHSFGWSFFGGITEGNRYTNQFAFDSQLGVFYEKKLSKKILFSVDMGLRYRQFRTDFGTCDNSPANPDYEATCHSFISDWNLLSVATSVNFKFYFFKKRKLYLEFGGGIDSRLNKSPELEYVESSVYDHTGYLGRTFVQEGKDLEDKFNLVVLENTIYPRLDLGLGFRVKDYDLGLIYRLDFVSTLCLRFKAPFLRN